MSAFATTKSLMKTYKLDRLRKEMIKSQLRLSVKLFNRIM